jgi:serine/threonine protein kinase
MRVNASTTRDGLRTVRHRSLARRTWCDADLPPELVEALCTGNVDDVLFRSAPLQVKDRCIVGRYECGTNSLQVKRHVWGGLSRTLRMAFRESAARGCARLGTYLHSLGVRTPRPRGTVEFRIGPWTYRSYLISDYIEGTSLYRSIRVGSQTDDELRHLARQVAQTWQQLVTLGVSHNDLKPENFIVDDDLRVWLIDLERMRIGGNAERQRERQVFDVHNFLHVRGWHHRAEARAIFAEAFLQTPGGKWLRSTGVDRVALGTGLSATECDAELSALILCDGGINLRLARQAIESLQNIADEVVLAEPTHNGRLEVLKHVEPFQSLGSSVAVAESSAANVTAADVTRHPWVLVLHQNECVTPFLAKELQQRIADTRAGAAFRIPLKRQYFGRTVLESKAEKPIRLFRQSDCGFSVEGGAVRIEAAADRTGQLIGTIQSCECATVAEFVERLNDESSRAAAARLQAGERPRLVRALWRAAWTCIGDCVRRGGIRSGWAGVQFAAIRSAFAWIEEAKLYQLASEFRPAGSQEMPSGQTTAEAIDDCESTAASWSKAA